MNLELVVIQGRPLGKTLPFPPGEYFLGRGQECHVRFDCEWVSRQHCLLRVGGGDAFLRDLGSRNGTVVNGALLLREHRLAPGDQVQLGPVVLEVRFATAPTAEGPSATLSPNPAGEPSLPAGAVPDSGPPTDTTVRRPYNSPHP